jgi:hypothetical protein
LVLCLLHLAGAAVAGAQAAPWSVSGEVYAGGELEDYLRLLQSTGKSALYPMSLRGLSVREVERLAPRDSLHPWAGRFDFGRPASGSTALQLRALAPRLGVIHNSAFPYGTNDGPVWAGRGLTTVAQAGFTARYRGVSLVVAPMAFRAENQDFDIVDPPEGDQAYADWRHPLQIDLPQRFGDGAYTRIDPGESSLRIDAGPVALEASTANQVWGPAMEYPIVIGTNAPGFPHVILGSSRPLNVWIGRVHGRFVWGGLSQSPYSTMPADSSRRFVSGFVGTFTPRGVPGLELGAGRFFHTPWLEDGVSLAQIARPFETLSKVNLVRKNGVELEASVVANQIASAFFRWVLPRSGLDLFGEFASEDHRHNLRDFLLEPDHDTAYELGLRKVWGATDARFMALRAELVSGEASHLQRARRQEPFYIHARMRQGHTERGQILGTPAAYGGSASTLGLDLFHPGGRWSIDWQRTSQQRRGTFLEAGEIEEPDVQQALGAEALVFRGRWELTGRLAGVYDFNRNFVGDVFGTSASLSVAARF